jgi:excisionase family DNA binding protein
MNDPCTGADELLRVGKVAVILAVHRTTVYKLIREGRLPTVTVGCQMRVPSQAVQDYITQNYSRSKPTTAAGRRATGRTKNALYVVEPRDDGTWRVCTLGCTPEGTIRVLPAAGEPSCTDHATAQIRTDELNRL